LNTILTQQLSKIIRLYYPGSWFLFYLFVFEWLTLQLEKLYIWLDLLFEPFEDIHLRKEATRTFARNMRVYKVQEQEMVRQYYIHLYKSYQIYQVRSFKFELKNLKLRPKALALIKRELTIEKNRLEVLCEKERLSILKQYAIHIGAYIILREKELDLIQNNYWAFRFYLVLDYLIFVSDPIFSWEKISLRKLLQRIF